MDNSTTHKQGYDIYHDLPIKAPINKIFQMVSEPSHLINWWPDSCTGKPVLNEEYNFYFGPKYDWYGKVTKLETDKSFHIKMTKSDPDWDPTTFGFDMEQKENYVLVKFWHKGWPECNDHFRTSSFCWALLLNGLKNYAEKGVVVPFAERS